MKTFVTALHRNVLLAALPAMLAFAGCSKKSDPTPPAPDQGRVLLIDAAAGVNVASKFLIDDVEKSSLTYGQNSAGYQSVNVGAHTIKVNTSTTTQTIATQQLNVEKDKSYSYFLYTPSTTAPAASLLVTDDLTSPASGKAKIRLVHLGQGIPSSINLSETQTVNYADRIPGVTFGTASNYLEINAGTFNLVITTGTAPASTRLFDVGDGTGTGLGTKNYEAGKIYTIVVRGVESNFDTNLKVKAYVLGN